MSSTHHVGNPSAEFIKDYQGKMIIQPKDLNIVWGRDDRYWTIPQKENLPAELHQVSWLEVTGSVNGTSPSKSYEVGFRVSLTPDAFGWGSSPIYIMVKRGKHGKFAWRRIVLNSYLTAQFEITGRLEKAESLPLPGQDSDYQKLYFGLYEVWSGKWKGGLKIHHAFVRELD
ncbi:protein PHLOEM PROTEIN 2-LIKE A9 [Sesamum alatum]|uniref:Protein PHLOEM PROTEIN 2-LIKE A9 n=1 Tax=Sesamum alatum TaxID=300844 RepID=A0AAE1Z2K0_9LAMI|nr:protein PHLOEM PROTEIN 2-LIKE A9 [Sesamum alatum]